MKTFTILLAIFCCMNTYSQNKNFTLEGKTVDSKGEPIADVYIINPRTLEKDITRANGVFSVTVSPQDSLIFSHISYFRKSVHVYELLQNPQVILDSEDVQIPEVIVSPDKTTDIKRAQENLQFLDEYKPLKYNKIKPESDPTTTIMTEHNRLMRTEAGSVSFLPILGLPIQLIDNAVQKRKRRKKHQTDYYSTQKVKMPPIDTITNPDKND
ncbi:hypothetical protein [uncultured Draconibacterium sp.]|uniref:hypothetical protein n=1 Tax=uncultured Draconibacterium sp. TaxID=1573823 RepID=UPI002AA94885|nr:hypothetical protein [uncultured Draconibacterium sp.]